MASAAISDWLRAKQRKNLASSSLIATAELVGGIFVLLLTFGFILLFTHLLVLIFFPMARHSILWSALLALPFVVLLFVDSIHADRDDMAIIPLWFAREYFLIGPRLILDARRRAAYGARLAELDTELCARVLAFLINKSTPTSQRELLETFPDLVWNDLVDQLRLVPGVILFRPDATRVTLIMPVRLELRALLRAEGAEPAVEEPEPEPVHVTQPEKLSPLEILGVSAGASMVEIKIAYRNRVKECHPDRFANMDDRARALAEEWTKALNAAYEELVAQYTGKRRGS